MFQALFMEESVMLRTPPPVVNVLAVTVCSSLALGSATVVADPPCNNASLSGTFYYTVAQIHVTAAGPDYCDEYGTAVADGAGNLRTRSQRRCSLSAPTAVPDTGRSTYRVNADCTVLVTEVRDDGRPGDTSHGKILMKGDMVLVDGTTRTDSSKLQHAVAVRTSRDKTLPPAAPAPKK